MKGIIICTFDLLLKHFKHNLILIFQLIITFLILLGFIGKVQYILITENITHTFDSSNAYYYYPYSFTSEEFSAEKILSDNNISDVNVGTVYYMLVECDQSEKIAVCYNDTIISHTRIDLSTGKWFDKIDYTDKNTIPIIAVGDAYNINDKITFTDINGQKTNAKIIGTINKDENILTFDSGATASVSSLEFFISKPYCDFIVPFNSTTIPSLSENYDMGKKYGACVESNGEVIIPKNNASNINFENIFKMYGTIVSLDEMTQNYIEDTNSELLVNGVILVVFILLTAAGIGGINGMQSRLNQRNYIIYYMLGMNRHNCALTELFRSNIIVLLGFLASVSIYSFEKIRYMLYPIDGVFINWFTFTFAYLTISLVSCIISLKYVLKLGQGDLIEYYKNRE